MIAGAIDLFGDGPLAWRLGSLICGSLAILGMYALTRSAGGSPWLALGAATLMALDNLLIVHSRIGTLDIYALAAMIWAAAAYMRRRPIAAGVLLGIGACAKEVAFYLLAAFVALEVLRWIGSRTDALRRLGQLAILTLATWITFFAGLAIMDKIAPPFDATVGEPVTGGPFKHFAHIVTYAQHQTSPSGPAGIASYPWQWLFDMKWITYLQINPGKPVPGLARILPAVHFLGVINPAILALAIPALVLGLLDLRDRRSQVGLLGLAWFLGTWLPYELQSLIWDRTSYIYYMVIVMPGIYLAVAQLLARIGGWLAGTSRVLVRRVGWTLVGTWCVAVLVAAVLLYPFAPVLHL